MNFDYLQPSKMGWDAFVKIVQWDWTFPVYLSDMDLAGRFVIYMYIYF